MSESNEPRGRLVDLGTATGRLLGKNPSLSSFGFDAANDGRSFSSGAKRDSAAGKPRPDLLSPFATLRRGRVMALGAVKYGDRNWEKGMPLSVFLASAERHLNQFKMGDIGEDHLGHLAFNIDAIMHGQEMIARGIWPAEYNDLPSYVDVSKKGQQCEQTQDIDGLLEPAQEAVVSPGHVYRQGGSAFKPAGAG
jgi:hypothetical protein